MSLNERKREELLEEFHKVNHLNYILKREYSKLIRKESSVAIN